MSVKKLITVSNSGYLPEIKVNGPIKTPTYVKVDAVRALVLNGRRVSEHNPANPSEKIVLNVSNSVKVNFGDSVSPEKPVNDTPENVDTVPPVTPPEDNRGEDEVPVNKEPENVEDPVSLVTPTDEVPETTPDPVDNTDNENSTSDSPVENTDENPVETPEVSGEEVKTEDTKTQTQNTGKGKKRNKK